MGRPSRFATAPDAASPLSVRPDRGAKATAQRAEAPPSRWRGWRPSAAPPRRRDAPRRTAGFRARHRRRTIASRPCRRPSPARNFSSTTHRRATRSCSSSTATTSPIAPISRYPRSSPRARGSRRTRSSGSRTCSSSCSRTTGRRGSPSPGTRGRCSGEWRRLQVRPPADGGPPPRAVPLLPADRRGLRLPEPRVRGLGGGRRHRHARHRADQAGIKTTVVSTDRTRSSSSPRTSC